MQAANRSATRRRFSTSRSASTPPSDDNSPPSNLATTALPDTGDRPGSGSIGSFMAGVASRKWRRLASAPKSYASSAACATPANPHEFFRLGTPEEFGAACAFLCSAHAGFITGQNWLLDGGA